MEKAILVVDMPKSCDMCDFTEMVNGKLYCGIPGCGELAEDYIACRAEFCPLQPMPEKREGEFSTNWIPCSERLPNIGERVLLWVYGQSHIGKRIDAKLFGYDIFSLERGTNESTKRIEAWMPLPEPYRPIG